MQPLSTANKIGIKINIRKTKVMTNANNEHIEMKIKQIVVDGYTNMEPKITLTMLDDL